MYVIFKLSEVIFYLFIQYTHTPNPSLQNYRLDFIRYSKFWGGPTGTLVPTANAHVWGVIWRLEIEHVDTLDM